MMQTIEFINATLDNIGSMVGSIDNKTIISVSAFFIAFLTLYLTHLRGMSISLHAKCELPELSEDDFGEDVPTSLPVKVTLLVLNSGNSAGIVKDLEFVFNPQPDFKEFYRDTVVEWDSIRSAKTDQPLDSAISIKNQDTDLVIFNGNINLDWEISMSHPLTTLDIESNNLKTLLEKMLQYKKEKLKQFINLLTKNEKIGDFIISYSYTKPKFIFWVKFKNRDIHLKVGHSYKKTIKCYEDSLENYQLSLPSTRIIKSILKSIKVVKEEFDRYRTEIEERLTEKRIKENVFNFSLNSEWINRILSKEDEDFELISKCRNYRKTIEEDVKSLLNELLRFHQKVQEANVAPTEKLQESLNEDIKKEKEVLMKKLKEISPKLEELKNEVEHELS